jgi:hypothetical protein
MDNFTELFQNTVNKVHSQRRLHDTPVDVGALLLGLDGLG